MQHSSSRTARLSPPPRIIPTSLFVQVIFGNMWNLVGWILIGVGSILFWLLAAQADLTSWYRYRGDLDRTEGRLNEMWDTNVSINEKQIYGYTFTFAVSDGRVITATSYSTHVDLHPGQYVAVEYPKGDPDHPRIRGMRPKLVPFLGVLGAIPLAIGFVIVWFGMRNGLRAIQLLRDGELTTGTLVNKAPTNVQVNNQPVYKYTFSFTASNRRTYEATAKTHNIAILEDEDAEFLVYNPLRPEQAVLVDSLPGKPRCADDGSFRASAPASLLQSIFIPSIVIIGNIIYIAVRAGS